MNAQNTKMKPILAIDFDGALLKSRPFDEAHKRWFEFFAILLKDDSIKKYAFAENWFEKVDVVMDRYLGNAGRETKNRFAREIYAMAIIAEANENDLVKEFADYLRKIKNKYTLALITTTTESSVEPILKKVGCGDLFGIIKKSSPEKRPDKKGLFKEFIKEHGKPEFYIGNGDKDIQTCKELGIKTISVNWVSKGEFKGDYDVDNVKDLEKALV